MQINATFKAVAPWRKSSFQASGGVPPYTYSVIPGGAGGTIDPVTGVYTAPEFTGTDVIRATDADGVHVDMPVRVLGPLRLFCDVIQTEMELASDQVVLYHQKFDIPKDMRLYIAVGVLNPKAYGVKTVMDLDGRQVQVVNMSTLLSVDLFSRTTEALRRKEELIMALGSFYSKRQQQAMGFNIASLPASLANISEEDGAAIPYRFSGSVVLQYAVKRTKEVPFYEDFVLGEILTEGDD